MIYDKHETTDTSPCHARLIVCISAKTAVLVITLTHVDRRQLSIGDQSSWSVFCETLSALDAAVNFSSLYY